MAERTSDDSVNEPTKQAALKAFAKDTGWELEQIEHYLQCFNENTGNAIENTAGAKVYNWLRAWELATQAANKKLEAYKSEEKELIAMERRDAERKTYERAAQMCDKTGYQDGYPIHNDSFELGALRCAAAIRALANESSGKGEKG